jgi:hypothetical protein
MKKLLSTLLLCFCFSSYAQYDNSILEVEDFSFDYISSSNNMSVLFPELSLIEFENHYIMAFVNNNPVSASQQIIDGSAGIPVCGLDGFGDYPWWASDDDIVEFYILMDNSIVQVEISPQVTFSPNGIYSLSGGWDCRYLWEDGVSCNFHFYINGESLIFGCTDSNYNEYISNANIDDGSCMTLGILGCMNPDAINFDETATIDDEQSCIYSQDYVHGLWNEVDVGAIEYEYLQEEYNSLNANAINSTSSLQQALDTWNTSIDLSAGWNMFGYGCPNSIDLVQGLSNHTDFISIVKDNNGAVYIPEFSFNGIGDLMPGAGYQIKLTEAIEGFSLCDWYVNDIPEDNIVSLQEEVENLQAELDSIYGCTDETACNYDVIASLDDGSCDNNDLGCGCDTPGPIEGYDCDGNLLPIYQVGDYAQGGIVFYVDETGQHGLVAAMESLYGLYEWGCYGTSISGADGTSIGTGYQNTIDIVAGCSEIPIAAGEALAYESEGYSDWYLPSKDELLEMYHTIGNGGLEGDVGGFGSNIYWSSSEYGSGNAWFISFWDGGKANSFKSGAHRVRVIRSF